MFLFPSCCCVFNFVFVFYIYILMQYLHFLFRLWSYWHVVGSAGSIFSKTLHSKASISALFALATLGLTWFFYIESTGNWCRYAIYRKIAIDATLQSFQKFSCVTAALSVALKLLPLPHKSHKSWLHFFSIIFAVLKLWPYFHLFFFWWGRKDCTLSLSPFVIILKAQLVHVTTFVAT